jgi:hypothetical protein
LLKEFINKEILDLDLGVNKLELDDKIIRLRDEYLSRHNALPTDLVHQDIPRLYEHPEFIELVERDSLSLDKERDLDIMSSYKGLIIPQSITGHAQRGHCEFTKVGTKYSSVIISDVARALGKDIVQFKDMRERAAYEAYAIADLALDGKLNGLTIDDHPLFGVYFLSDFWDIDPIYLLKGMVLAGFMDSYPKRAETMEAAKEPGVLFRTDHVNHNLNIGGGETYLVNKEVLDSLDISYLFLSSHSHDDEDLALLKEMGAILDEDKNGDCDYAYIRRRRGLGTSDDAAFNIIGSMYKHLGNKKAVSAMLGAFIVDAVDTYDKCILNPVLGGVDEQLAKYIQESWKQKFGRSLVENEEIMTLIYYSAKNNSPELNVSSSHIRLAEKCGKKRFYQSTMMSYIDFVEGKKIGNFKIAFKRMDSRVFLERIEKRINHMYKNSILFQ